MNPRVRAVVPGDEYTQRITLTNGEVGVYNCSHLISFGVFSEFQDVHYFRRARMEHGTVAWPDGQDICPDALYLDSAKVTSTR